jgi:nickel/cobalt exporter
MNRRRLLLLLGVAASVAAVIVPARPASAHPLGNFTVNHLDQLRLRADGVIVDAVVDMAEIPTAQALPDVDTDRNDDASTAERDAYAQDRCAQLARAQVLTIDGANQVLVLEQALFDYTPGQAGLPASRLECSLRVQAQLVAGSEVHFRDDFAPGRIGWREVVAAGDGVELRASDVLTTSVTDGLRTYPDEQLNNPPKVTEATVTVGAVSGARAGAGSDGRRAIDDLGMAARGPAAGPLERVQQLFEDLVGRRDLTWPVGLAAVGLAMLLGVSHALLPGHGKTIMAAYIAGSEGTTRDAVLVGATVTGTHTSGVLLLGLALTLSTALAGEVVIGWLGVVSGVFVVGLGVALLVGTIRRGGRSRWSLESHHHGPFGHGHGAHTHGSGHTHTHGHGGGHSHDGHTHGGGHSHTHGGGHSHDGHSHDEDTVESMPATRQRAISRLGLVGMGAAGGLVPSPSALIILLSTIALGRTAFGVLLVLAYGVGMAATLTAAGVLLVRVRDRWVNRLTQGASRLSDRWRRVMPYATTSLIIVVGAGLTLRSVGGLTSGLIGS